jgi:hypothetical protein
MSAQKVEEMVSGQGRCDSASAATVPHVLPRDIKTFIKGSQATNKDLHVCVGSFPCRGTISKCRCIWAALL